MIYELVQAFFFIIMAEMGDKTQMLAMAFATKYSLGKVLVGVFLGSTLNHGLAALLGVYLTHLIPLEIIRLVAAFAFIGFGLWNLKIDVSKEDSTSYRFGAVLTVALAFAIGELGDKTQLAVITLSTQAAYPLLIILGSVSGMVVISGLGVFVGSRLGKRIPEMALKVISSLVFISFGLLSLREAAPTQYMSLPIAGSFMFVLTSTVLLMLRNIYKKTSMDTPLKKAAGELYLNTQRVQEALSKICQEASQCTTCTTSQCTIKHLQNSLSEAQKRKQFIVEEEWPIPLSTEKSYPQHALKKSLIEVINVCLECPNHRNDCIGNQSRKTLEILYFGGPIPFAGDKQKYYEKIKSIEPGFFHENL